ncbi:MAG: DNA replication and repair protein RecF [Nitrospinota bacterium]
MRLVQLNLRHFRNYQALTFEPAPRFNYIFGPNGSGKTNLLEAIHYLTRLRSFRRVSRRGMIEEGQPGMYLRGEFCRENEHGGEVTLEAAVQGQERRYALNGEEVSDLLSYLDQVHTAVFFPDSPQVIKGGPSLRRAFFDRAIASSDPSHLAGIREYNRLLAERNRLLKGGGNSDIFAVWNQRFLWSAARIVARRQRYLGALHGQLALLENSLSAALGRRIGIEYAAGGAGLPGESWGRLLEGGENPEAGAEAVLRSSAERLAPEERRRGAAQWGPHLDDFHIRLGARRAREGASQGEQRLAMLALVMAAAAGFRAARGEEPIVLLDDLSSELDERRRADVLRHLETMGAQVFITSTERSGGGGGRFHIEGGVLSAR